MLRKIIILLILFLWSIYYPSAEAQSPSNKRVVIFYAVSDGVISCQNSDGDLAKGKKQFEDTVRNNYKKRFVVDDIRAIPKFQDSASSPRTATASPPWVQPCAPPTMPPLPSRMC